MSGDPLRVGVVGLGVGRRHLEAFADDGGTLPIGGPKQRTALAVLCLTPGQPVSTERLIDAIWGDGVPDKANRSIATFISNLRRSFGDAIHAVAGGYQCDLDRSDIDLCVFEDHVRALAEAFWVVHDMLIARGQN